MKRTANTAPEIMHAECIDCGVPILIHRLATLPNGAPSLRRLAGRKRTRCRECQQNYKRVRWYVTPSGKKRRGRAKGDLLV